MGERRKKFFSNDSCNYRWILLDLAFVDSAFHQNVTVLSPSDSPRVANNPVVDSVFGSIADDDHTVVDIFIVALDVSVDAAPASTILRETCGDGQDNWNLI
jgi:hypothetical protein